MRGGIQCDVRARARTAPLRLRTTMPLIEFLARAQDLGRSPRPYPASRAIPDWVKSMPMERGGGPTLKHCPPLLEAMTAGYIIPAPCDVVFNLTADAKLSWQCPDNL